MAHTDPATITINRDDVTLTIVKQWDTEYPKVFTIQTKQQPKIVFSMDCPYELYHDTYVMAATFIKEFIKAEDDTVRNLDYQTGPALLGFIKTTNLFVLPGCIAELTNCCANDDTYNTFTRVMNALLSMEMSFDQKALMAIKSRFFWFLASMKIKHENSFSWTFANLYDLICNFDWVWILGVYQTFASPMFSTNSMRTLLAKNRLTDIR